MNWGTKLVIGMALFMSFILILVLKMAFSPEDALIDKDYYEKGQNYNVEYDAKQRAVQDSVVPEINVSEDGLTINFKQAVDYKLTAKRPSDIKMDKQFDGKTDETFSINLPESELAKGPWKLTLQFNISDKEYLVEREIIMP